MVMASISSIAELLYSMKLYIPLFLIVWYSIHSYLSYRRLSHIPGPSLAGWSSLWLVGAIWRKQSHLEFYDVAEQYGSIARIGPNMLLTTDLELLRRMSAARSPYVRSKWYLAFRLAPAKDNVFSMLDDKAHTKRRAQMNNGYLGKENITLEPTIDQNIVKFIRLVRSNYVSSGSNIRPMDLAQKAQFLTMDVIMDIATGAPMGDLENDADVHAYLKTTADALPALIMMGSVPAVHNLIQTPFIAKRLFPTAEDKIGLGRLIGIAQEMVAKRFSSDENEKVERMDMLQSFIKHGLSQEEAVAESLIQILGGSDTAAGAIRTFMLYLMSSPRVYSSLQAEIDAAVREGRISHPIVSDQEARALPYLQAVIKEGLRIWPPGTGLLAKQVPPEGDTVNGILLPGGTDIGVNTWAVMRNIEVFGDDADVFRPERWLEATPEQLAKMEKSHDWVWGYGKYVCLGKSVALIELNKIFVELLRNFDWALMNPMKPPKIGCYGIFVMTDLWVKVTERETKF